MKAPNNKVIQTQEIVLFLWNPQDAIRQHTLDFSATPVIPSRKTQLI